jgi:hypothetical protein
MVAKRHGSMTVEDFLALDRERLDQKYEFRNGHLPPLDPFRGLGKRKR